jgi:hypothetical protein
MNYAFYLLIEINVQSGPKRTLRNVGTGVYLRGVGIMVFNATFNVCYIVAVSLIQLSFNFYYAQILNITNPT